MRRPLRVAVVFEYPVVRSEEQAALDLIRRLDRTRYEPVAIVPPWFPLTAARAAGAPTRLHHLRRDGRKLAPYQCEEAFHDGVGPADIIHANSLSLALPCGPVGVRRGCPTIAHCRDIFNLSGARIADISKVTRLIAVSHAVRRSLVEQGIPGERIVAIPDGVDATKAASGRPGRLRAELGLRRDVPLVGCIGEVNRSEGQDILIEAAGILSSRLPEAHFVLVGQRFSKKAEAVQFEEKLHRMVPRLGIAGRVHFLGERSDVPNILADLTAFAHPAKRAPQPMAILEAMAAGLPVVATSVDGTPELIGDGETGLLVPRRDARALARALERVLADRALAERLGEAARARASADFRPEDTARRVMEVYEELSAAR